MQGNEFVRKSEGILNGFGKFGWGTIKGAGFIGKTAYDVVKTDGAVIGNKLGLVSNTTIDKSRNSANNDLNTWKLVPGGIVDGVGNIIKNVPRLITDSNITVKDVSNLTNDILTTGFIAKGTYDVTNKVGTVAKTVIPKVYRSMGVASKASKTAVLRPSIAGFGDISGTVNPFDSIMTYAKTFKNEIGNGVTAKSGISGVKEPEMPKIDKVEVTEKAKPITEKEIKPKIRGRILKNINESRIARESSNYHEFSKIDTKIYAENNNWVDKAGDIIWPPDRGLDGESVSQFLKLGTRVDRYGFEGGTFVSPEGMPYPSRALAPGTNTKPYYVYEVIKPVEVQAGKIASWFGEPGGGIQYELGQSIKKLIKDEFLRRVELK